MRRKVTIGPEKIDATLGPLQDYLDDVAGHGAPEDTRVRVETTPDGATLMVTAEYEEEVEARPQTPAI